MLKRWRYVGVFGPELMLCAGVARIGPTRQAWWAIWDREQHRLHERTRLLAARGRIVVAPGRVLVRERDVEIDLALAESAGIEVVTPDAGGYAWTRKQGAARARGTVRAGARRWEVDGAAVIDDSAGYHPRRTAWRWSAGSGLLEDGRPVAWNLVAGVHDSPHASERTVWLAGEPQEVGPVAFDPRLAAVSFAEGGELAFAAEATRRRHDRLLVVSSRYEQPFGTFTGSLPGAGELAAGYGVMERHEALW